MACSRWSPRPAKRARLAALADALPGVAWDRLLFSAKESVYKAWAPIDRHRSWTLTARRS